uniref:Uncharacterized protein n=1 Tax=Arundo donax TaxID=35708 RepID=A0A0A9AFE2_ARUDO
MWSPYLKIDRPVDGNGMPMALSPSSEL